MKISLVFVAAILAISSQQVHGVEEEPVPDINPPEHVNTGCIRYADIIFVIDSSFSIQLLGGGDTDKYWIMQLDFTERIVDKLEISAEYIQVGVVIFGFDVRQEIALNNNMDKDNLKNRIRSISFMGGSTPTGRAIAQAREMFRTQGRQNVERVIILITDGRPSDGDPWLEEARKAREDDNTILATIGVGTSVNFETLDLMASRAEMVKVIRNFDDLLNVIIGVYSTVLCRTRFCTRLDYIDLLFIIPTDTNLDEVKGFVRDIINTIRLDYTSQNYLGSRVALITMGDRAQVVFNLDRYVGGFSQPPRTMMIQAVNGVQQSGSRNNMEEALQLASSTVFVPNGDRAGMRNLIIMLATQRSNNPAIGAQALQLQQDKLVTILALAVSDSGNADPGLTAELRQVASKNPATDIPLFDDVNGRSLRLGLFNLMIRTCEVMDWTIVEGIEGSQGPDGPPGPPGQQGSFGTPGTKGNVGGPGRNGGPGSPGNPGIPGGQGIKGDPGTFGDRGSPGLPGFGGTPGAVGDNGQSGFPGQSGGPGDKGFPGGPGSVGLPGNPGVGVPGSKGTKGNAGEAGGFGGNGRDGSPGLPGSLGQKGESGAQGFPGSKGNRGGGGLPGQVGAPGIQGDPGPSGGGVFGPTGDRGSPGNSGNPGQSGFPGGPGLPGDPGNSGLPGSTGDKGTRGNSGQGGTPGAKGGPGTKGAAGDAGRGSPGDKGDRGNNGSPGRVGTSGRPGTSGNPGPKGLKGFPGGNGRPGSPGTAGQPGFSGGKGQMGESGFPGSPGQGFPGQKGFKGGKGFNGGAGNPGPSGFPGSPGLKGQRGDNGRPGPSGDFGNKGGVGVPGLKGNQGTAGVPGQPGAGLPGLKGFTGQAGRDGNDGRNGGPGTPGNRGAKGAKGFVGQGGTDGSPGSPGFPGSMGDKGDTGYTGPRGGPGFTSSGTKGVKGFPGNPGIPGSNGSPGNLGPKGITGARGPNGFNGQPGNPGFKGNRGFAGTPGGNGIQGVAGPPGQRGQQGFRGQSGDPGDFGFAGVKGFRGLLGPQGNPGPQGVPGNNQPGVKGVRGPTGFPGGPGQPGGIGGTYVDKCLDNNGGCQQLCVSTFFSHYCACYPGYTLLEADEPYCPDVARPGFNGAGVDVIIGGGGNTGGGGTPQPFPASDVVFLLDASTATDNLFPQLITYMSELIGSLNANSGDTRFGVIGYHSGSTVLMPLEYRRSVQEVQNALRGLRGVGGFGAFLYRGLTKAGEVLDLSDNSRGKLIVIISFGNDQVRAQETTDIASRLRNSNVQMVAIGIGAADNIGLLQIAPSGVVMVTDQRFLSDSSLEVASKMRQVLGGATGGRPLVDPPTPPSGCANRLDLALIVDASSSLSMQNKMRYFQYVRMFLQKFVQNIGVSYSGVRVGIVVFSNTASLKFKLDQTWDLDQVIDVIENLPYIGGKTNIADGLRLTRTELFASDAGDRFDANNLAVLISDGRANIEEGEVDRQAQQLKSVGVTLLCVGISDEAYVQDLRRIASRPEYVVYAEQYDELMNRMSDIISLTCSTSGYFPRADIAVVIDTSDNIEIGMSNVRDQVTNLMSGFNFGPGSDVQVGLVEFGQFSRIVQRLDSNTQSVIDRIRSMTQTGGREPNIEATLNMLMTEFFTKQNGDVPESPNVVLFFTTGGVSASSFQAAADKLKTHGIALVSIGVRSSVTLPFLKSLAYRPELAIQANSYAQLSGQLDVIARAARTAVGMVYVPHWRPYIPRNELCFDTGRHGIQCFCWDTLESLNSTKCININECMHHNGGCSHVCVDKEGMHECFCPEGLQLGQNRHSCEDVNECERNPCSAGDECINTFGGYNCLRENFQQNPLPLGGAIATTTTGSLAAGTGTVIGTSVASAIGTILLMALIALGVRSVQRQRRPVVTTSNGAVNNAFHGEQNATMRASNKAFDEISLEASSTGDTDSLSSATLSEIM